MIKIGGLTETDRVESRYRVESAMFSCHVAIENGYGLGGGIQYVRAQPFVEKLVAKSQAEQAGIDAVAIALEAPLRQLLKNCRVNNPAEMITTIKKSTNTDDGFNAERKTIEDLRKAGVVDPAKTLKEAMLFAFSYARGIVETGAWEIPFSEKEEINSQIQKEIGS